MSALVIRSAREEDVGAVLAIERVLATAPHWAEAEYLRIVGGEGAVRRCLLVGAVDGRMVGFAVGMMIAGVGELESVAVLTSRQGQGFGRELVRAVIAWCTGAGAREIELEVRAASAAPMRLYAGLGFVEVGRRPGYYADPSDDAVLMRKTLLSPGGWLGDGQEAGSE